MFRTRKYDELKVKEYLIEMSHYQIPIFERRTQILVPHLFYTNGLCGIIVQKVMTGPTVVILKL